MSDALGNSAAAVAAVIRRCLKQDETTPFEDRLSMRVLLEEALPLLEQLAHEHELNT